MKSILKNNQTKLIKGVPKQILSSSHVFDDSRYYRNNKQQLVIPKQLKVRFHKSATIQ